MPLSTLGRVVRPDAGRSRGDPSDAPVCAGMDGDPCVVGPSEEFCGFCGCENRKSYGGKNAAST